MKKIKILPILALIFLVATACSKQKKLERTLHKKNGTWNIDSYNYNEYENNVLVSSQTYVNAGTYVFADNGTGTATFKIDGDSEVNAFTWTNTDDKITTIIDGEVIIFNVKNQSKKEMELEYLYEYEFLGDVYKFVVLLKMTKE
jgi:hypothetical protein